MQLDFLSRKQFAVIELGVRPHWLILQTEQPRMRTSHRLARRPHALGGQPTAELFASVDFN